MHTDASPVAERGSIRRVWIAIAWAEGLNLVGFMLAVGALLSNFCVLHCGPPEPMSGGAKLALAIGIAVLVCAPVLAARSSGRPVWLGVGILALLAGVAGFFVGVELFGEFGPALALGLVAEGAVAVRPPSRAAVAARSVAAAVVLAFAATDMYPIVLVALPAIGLADTLAVALAAPRRRDAAPTLGPR